ncbi:hypothetical protein BKA70DRAFT_1123222 [Coprinopsis sp. MPI-PUGE-AT-0042]|nr:hypothetical protein BKA70DRAFT_1123222 [Coprinopsis sp. MPI-PUGE-AT-0042]
MSDPVGLIWDHTNYSCAYDAIFTILYNLWSTDTILWGQRFRSLGKHVAELSTYFDQPTVCTLEQARDRIRSKLAAADPALFPCGKRLTSLEQLLTKLFHVEQVAETVLTCPVCTFAARDDTFALDIVSSIYPNHHRRNQRTVEYSVADAIHSKPSSVLDTCPRCADVREMSRVLVLTKSASILIIEIVDQEVRLDASLSLCNSESHETIMRLRGLIYLGEEHFTSRWIDGQGQIWFHNGATTGRLCQFDGRMDERRCLENLRSCRGNRLCYAVYACTE